MKPKRTVRKAVRKPKEEPETGYRYEFTPRTDNQKELMKEIQAHDVTFALGPAGSGKTFVAVAAAVRALQKHDVSKIVLVRPVVEAGERLGYLPGTLQEKVDPYMRPLYDALEEMFGAKQVQQFVETGTIEVAPLAYMRGRTLKHSFILMDEAQNMTKAQMLMALTRIGEGSKTVITGDLSQTDLPSQGHSGLREAIEVLSPFVEIGIVEFEDTDVVRHPIVQLIVNAYEGFRKEIQ